MGLNGVSSKGVPLYNATKIVKCVMKLLALLTR